MLLAVRADLVERCVDLAPLRPALATPVFLGPLSETELRQAIVTPAQDAGVAIEPGLPERLMADLGVRADGGYDPAALPRLAHALRETWRHGDGVALTLDGYRRAGGVDGAVARTAEQVYSALDDAGRDVARNLLLRLVIVPDEGSAVRRRADRDTLDVVDSGTGVLDRLVAARLVTVDGDGARISHEALLTAWPRLRDWIDLDRAGLVQHRRLSEAATAWRESGAHIEYPPGPAPPRSLDGHPGMALDAEFAPTGRCWRPRATTGRYGCGACPTGFCRANSSRTRPYARSRSARTAPCSSRRPRTRWCGSGPRPTVAHWPSSTATPTSSTTSRSTTPAG